MSGFAITEAQGDQTAAPRHRVIQANCKGCARPLVSHPITPWKKSQYQWYSVTRALLNMPGEHVKAFKLGCVIDATAADLAETRLVARLPVETEDDERDYYFSDTT